MSTLGNSKRFILQTKVSLMVETARSGRKTSLEFKGSVLDVASIVHILDEEYDGSFKYRINTVTHRCEYMPSRNNSRKAMYDAEIISPVSKSHSVYRLTVSPVNAG